LFYLALQYKILFCFNKEALYGNYRIKRSSYIKNKEKLSFGDHHKNISVQQLSYLQDSDNENYYRILWVLKGVKSIQAGVDEFKAFPNLIVFVAPGKKLSVISETEPEGWVLRIVAIRF
jgi:hypothetical protein